VVRWCAVARALGDIVARGTRSTVFAYGRGAVAKVPVPSTPDDWIRYEARYAEAARVAGAPAPRLVGLEQIDGRVASIWEHAVGISMWQLVVDDPGRAAEQGRLLADLQHGLLALVPPVTLPRQRDRIEAKIRRTAATIDPSFGRALALLPPPTGTPRLCHGDLHPSNVLLTDDGPILVDWLDAARGDPLADVARSLLTMLADGADPPSHLPGADRATLGTLTDAFLARVDEHLGIDHDVLARWQAVGAVARMAEGVQNGPLLEVWRRFDQAAAN
jgi:aminoglycoside phosphotransferase (APT) family kinase protein